MEIRPLQSADFHEALRLDAICFCQSSDLTIKDSTAEDLKDAFGLFENGHLRSVMISNGQRMFFEGAVVQQAGIGSVATYPEHRRKGYVRDLFTALFPRMRDLGQAFSTLFPISFAYYRSFGYELAYSSNTYTIPLAQLKPRKDQSSLEEVTLVGGQLPALAEIKALYRDFAACRNLALDRSDADWMRMIPAEPHKSKEYCYLCRDASGAAQAYFQFKAVPTSPHRIDMEIRDLAWRGSTGLASLLSHLACFHPLAVKASMRLPSDLAIEYQVPDPYLIERRIAASYMVKVVDVQSALQATRFAGSGSLVIQVQDDTLDWNDGSFLLEWSAGSTQAVRTTREADLSLDVRTLAQLLVGYIGGMDLVDHGLAESALGPERLAAIFPRKALYQNDHF
jgi:predicted acetyltransferase